MARGWIKIDRRTPYKPHVSVISRLLRITEDSALAGLIRFWIEVDSSGNVEWTDDEIDELAGHEGFADAMHKVGWLTLCICEEKLYTVHHFEKHFSETEDE